MILFTRSKTGSFFLIKYWFRCSSYMQISAEKINWRVAIGELSLIVIGILMALAIDSYVGRRADRAVADAYLTDLVAELRVDAAHFAKNHEGLGRVIASASHLLRLVESSDEQHNDPASLLMSSMLGEGTTRQPAVWEELQMTGALRLIADQSARAAIVSHYLERANSFKTIDENFVPAVRDLRALAWEILPVESFQQYMTTGQSGVPGTTVMARLHSRDDSAYLLKRVIVTGTVARLRLKDAAESTAGLLTELGVPSESGIQ